MIHIVWEFEIVAGSEAEFEKHYGPDGTWVRLFRRARAFRGTRLLRDRENPNRYITIDQWDDLSSYDAFCEQFAEEYHNLDLRMEKLTAKEMKLGIFENLE